MKALGLTWIDDFGKPIPQCYLCIGVLANSYLKHTYLRRHLQTKHSNLKDNPVFFFIWKN